MGAIDTMVLHAAIVVRDLDSAVEGWTEFLGVGPASLHLVTARDAEYESAPTKAQCRQAIYDLGGFKIELIEPIGEPSVWADQLKERGEGLHHIAFRARGMEDGIEECKGQAIGLVQRGEFENGRYAYFDQTRLGAMIELLEFDPGHDEF